MSNDIIFPNDAVHNVNVNVKDFVPGKPGKSPYIGDNGHWFYYDEQTDQWLDSGTPAQGDPGADGADGADGENAVFYTLEPSTPYILYDPAAGSGEKNSPDQVTLYAYKYEAGVKTPYTATEIEADILYEDENGEIPTYHMVVGRTTNNIVVDVNEEDGWATIEASFTTYDNQTISCKVLPVRHGPAGSDGGLTANIKNALLQIARKIAYIDEHGQDYYDDLYDALYEVTGLTLDVSSISLGTIGATSQITATTVPSGAAVTWSSSDTSVATVVNGLVTAVGYGSATITASAGNLTAQCSVVIAQATVTSISAVYTPSGTIYETAIPALETLKSDLVVTAHWSNGTTSTVTDYALSGTLSVGSNTVTVSYGGQTTTITVTVVALSSISAVYTQSGTVYDTASLDDLKADLVVTATFADSTTQTVTGYTLSGTLTEGTSTITVSYAGKTTTFNVTVTAYVDPRALVYNWDLTQSLIDTVSGVTAVANANAVQSSSGVTINIGGCIRFCPVFSNGSIIKNRDYEFDIASMSKDYSNNHGRLVIFGGTDVTAQADTGFIYRSTGSWQFYVGGWSGDTTETSAVAFAGKTLRIHVDSSGNMSAYVNDTMIASTTGALSALKTELRLGDTTTGAYTTVVTAVRVYNISE